MAKDFRAERLRTSAIVGTGSLSAARPHLGLAIYSSSNAANWKGSIQDTNFLDSVGNDVWLVVSGAASGDGTYKSSQRLNGGAVLFVGDVVVSGTLWAERSIIEVDDSVVGDLRVPNSLIQGFQTSPTSGKALFLADATRKAITFNTTAGSSGVFSVGSSGPYSDTFFRVSGSIGSRGSTAIGNNRGTALFEGDLHTSGNFSTASPTTASFGGAVNITGSLYVTGGFYLAGDNIYDSGDFLVVSFDGKGHIDHLATLTGSSTDNSQVNLHGDKVPATFDAVRVESPVESSTLTRLDNIGQVRFRTTRPGTNAIEEVAYIRTIAAVNNSSTNMGVSLDFATTPPGTRGVEKRLQIIDTTIAVTGALKLSPAPAATTDGTPVAFARIVDDNDNIVMTLSGSGDATFNKNLTIVGNLNVSGSTTTINTTNLKVKDQLILLATGSEGPRVFGGVAITSGSDVANNALVWGTGQTANSFKASILDVQDGNRTTSLASGQPALIEAGGLILSHSIGANSFRLSGSNSTVGSSYNMTGSSPYGLLWESTSNDVSLKAGSAINLNAGGQGVVIFGDRKLYIGDDRGRYIQQNNNSLEFFNNDNTNKFRFSNASGIANEIRFGATAYPNTDKNRIISHQPDFSPSAYYDRHMLFISGSGIIAINNRGDRGASSHGLLLSLSQSADDTNGGGPTIFLSSSTEYGGGVTREGFITLGAGKSDHLNDLFTISRHRDVRTLLSGTIASTNTTTRGVTLVAGDLVTSGNADLKGTVTMGALSLQNLTLDSTTDDEPYIHFRDSNIKIFREEGGSNDHLSFKDVASPGASYTLTQLAALSVTDNADVFAVTHQDGSTPYLSYVASTGSFSFDHAPSNGYTARRTNQIGDDVFFFVSGTVGGKTAHPATRTVSVFGGDILASGSIMSERPYFVQSLESAYSTGPTGTPFESSELGLGALVRILGNRPIQLKGSTNENVVLGISGSLDFITGSNGAVGDNTIQKKDTGNLLFANSGGEVFRLIDGGSGTAARFPANNQLQFGADTSRYIRGLEASGKKRLELVSDTGGSGIIDLKVGNTGYMSLTGSMVPGADSTYNLGSPDKRWANVYTGDLHLRNERGNWTIYEEPDMLVVVNNLTGKKYKMGLTPLEDEE